MTMTTPTTEAERLLDLCLMTTYAAQSAAAAKRAPCYEALLAELRRLAAVEAHSKDCMTKDEKQVADLILSDPDGGRMVVSSELRAEADGAVRFTVTNPGTGRRFGVYLGLSELTKEKL